MRDITLSGLFPQVERTHHTQTQGIILAYQYGRNAETDDDRLTDSALTMVRRYQSKALIPAKQLLAPQRKMTNRPRPYRDETEYNIVGDNTSMLCTGS